MKTVLAPSVALPQSNPAQPISVRKQRFAIEKLEERIAPQGSLLDLNLNLTVTNVTVTLQHINLAVAGNVIQVGLLSGAMNGTVNSTVTANA